MKNILENIGDALYMLIILAIVAWFIYGFLGSVHEANVSYQDRLVDDAKYELGTR